MKRILPVLTLVSFTSTASDMTLASNIRGLPEDFRQYFYKSEIIVQVLLNDVRLFDAGVMLYENGDIRMLRSINETLDIDHDILAHWSKILESGVSIGKCIQDCQSGLMAVEYRLQDSVLKLYTSHYETARTKNNYIPISEDIPGGIIMYNDASVINTKFSRSWGVNSSLISALAGWSQKLSFQSSGVDGQYRYSDSRLYELFTQKEFQGSFLRLGLFTPESDSGNIQMPGFGYDTIAGALWATSDAFLVGGESVSAWPVYVTGRNQSIAEVWREGRLIHTQQLQAGIQALDTRPFPAGIYDIAIKIIEDGKLVDTQQAQIYKPQGWSNPDHLWRINIWGGQHRMLAMGDNRQREDNPVAVGGSIDIMAHPRAILGLSGAATEKENQLRVRSNMTLSPSDTLFAQYTLGYTTLQSNSQSDIRYYRNIHSGGSASVYWRSTTTDLYGHSTRLRQRGDSWGGSMSLRLPWSTSLTLNGQYMDTEWRTGFGADAAVTMQAILEGNDVNFRLSAYDRPGFNHDRRDYGISFGVSLSLGSSAHHIVSAETGMNQRRTYTSLNYQWQPGDGSEIRTLGTGVSYNPYNTVINGNAAVDMPNISGETYIQHNMQENISTLGGNLSQVLVMGGGHVTSVNGNSSRGMESAIIVNVDSGDPAARIVASGSMAETALKPGYNVIPAELWKKSIVQFSASGGDSIQVFPSRDSLQMGRGSVKLINVKAVRTFTLVGRLQDSHGNVIVNRSVSSDVSGGVVNTEGIVTLDASVDTHTLHIRAENGFPSMRCKLPEGLDKNQKVHFIGKIKCDLSRSGENQWRH